MRIPYFFHTRFAYLSFYQRNNILDLSTFNMDLTTQYQDEIMFKLNIKALSSIRLFYGIDAVFMNALVYSFEPSIFIKGEVIVGKVRVESSWSMRIHKPWKICTTLIPGTFSQWALQIIITLRFGACSERMLLHSARRTVCHTVCRKWLCWSHGSP